MNSKKIRKKYLDQHNALGNPKEYTALQRQQHDQTWIDCDVELKTRKVELVAKVTPTEDELVELRELKLAFPDPTPPPRDLAAEIDEIKVILNLK